MQLCPIWLPTLGAILILPGQAKQIRSFLVISTSLQIRFLRPEREAWSEVLNTHPAGGGGADSAPPAGFFDSSKTVADIDAKLSVPSPALV